MADTIRALSALQTLLADNSSRAISEQDVRDAVYSTLGVVPYVAKSSAYTLTEDDCVVAVTTGASDLTFTLPAVASTRVGKFYILIKVDSGAGDIVADGASAETINGAATKAVATQWSALLLVNTGAAWLGLTLTGA